MRWSSRGGGLSNLPVLLFALILLAWIGAGWPRGEEAPPQSGAITGRVVNATSDDDPLAQWKVTLQTYSNMAPGSPKTIETDGEGRFAFRELAVAPNRAYVVSASYKGVEYSSDPIVLDARAPTREIVLRVYERSADASHLRVDSHHMIIGPAEDGLRVQEIMVIRNATPYTYVGEGGFTLRFSLPSGVRNIGIGAELDEEGTTVLGNTVLISEPVSPHGRQIIYRYDLPVDASSYVLTRSVDYPTEKFDVFLTVPGATIESDRLEPREPLVVEGRQYLRLSGGGLTPDVAIELTIKGLPRRGMGALQVGVFVATALIIAGGLLYPFVRRRRRPTVGRNGDLSAERNALIEEIAALDDDFAEGNLSEEEYRSLREEKKRRLLAITRRIRGIAKPKMETNTEAQRARRKLRGRN